MGAWSTRPPVELPLCLFNQLVALVLRLLSPSLSHLSSSCPIISNRSFDMHHRDFGIRFLFHFASFILISLLPVHLISHIPLSHCSSFSILQLLPSIIPLLLYYDQNSRISQILFTTDCCCPFLLETIHRLSDCFSSFFPHFSLILVLISCERLR